MVACLSPSDTNFEETLSTLKYAHNTKFIANRFVQNYVTGGECKLESSKNWHLEVKFYSIVRTGFRGRLAQRDNLRFVTLFFKGLAFDSVYLTHAPFPFPLAHGWKIYDFIVRNFEYRRSMRFDYIFFKVRAGPGLYSAEDIIITLPKGTTMFDINYLAVYSEQVSFC